MFDLPLFEAFFMIFYSASAVGLRHGCWWMPIALVLRWVSMRWIPQHLQSWSSSSKHPGFAAELPCGDFFLVLEFSFEVEKQTQKCLVDFFLGGWFDLKSIFLGWTMRLIQLLSDCTCFLRGFCMFFLGPTHSSAKLFVEAIAQRSGFERSIWRLTYTPQFLKRISNLFETASKHYRNITWLFALSAAWSLIYDVSRGATYLKTQILHTDHMFFIFQSLEILEEKKSIELGKNAEAVAIHCHCWVCLLTGAPRLVSWSVLGTHRQPVNKEHQAKHGHV